MAMPPVLFLPGFMCDGRVFGPQMAALATAGVRWQVADYGTGETISAMARHAMADAPQEVALVGLSMGGIIALEVWRQGPERVTHMALLNATAREDASGPQRLAQLDRVMAGGLREVMRDALAAHYLAQGNRTPQRLALLEEMGMQLGASVFMRQTRALMARDALLHILPEVSCPVLVMSGDADTICPPSRQEEMAALLPVAETCTLSACGHIATLEQAEAVNAALLRLLSRPAGCGSRAHASGFPCPPSRPATETSSS
jgi:pimeloyl-ACP methyl ester carboxylesterase